jgi:hypothetical protein
VLNFVDLAGSERISESGGGNMKETSHINKSLFALANVINKLGEGGNSHIPYRDSKLTRILQKSLGGNSLTALICNINPSNYNLSISTLRLASRAKNITLKPEINEV